MPGTITAGMRKHVPLLVLGLAPSFFRFCPANAQAPLTLAQVTALAVQASPTLTAAGQTVAQAQARVGQAQAQRRLQITFNSRSSLSYGTEPHEAAP